ncbi:uncharacterized protein LOC121376201 [Gigantopelta aegis]|uniref:uncharacterized protein LOC121376201 n=1 Tax=Gigantopelta aegis TaxID=1735272 RepID=UPI001B889ED7|nr:uncharacterized protein LOC121376201 [Gigantopelta aegis]
MRIALVLALVLLISVSSSDAWGRRAWRRFKRIAVRAVKSYVIKKVVGAAIVAVGKRSASDLDTNMDGVLDKAEIESILNTRDAQEFIRVADEDGDDEISIDEFEKAVKQIENL